NVIGKRMISNSTTIQSKGTRIIQQRCAIETACPISSTHVKENTIQEHDRQYRGNIIQTSMEGIDNSQEYHHMGEDEFHTICDRSIHWHEKRLFTVHGVEMLLFVLFLIDVLSLNVIITTMIHNCTVAFHLQRDWILWTISPS